MQVNVANCRTRSNPPGPSVPASVGTPEASWFLNLSRSASPDAVLPNVLRELEKADYA